MVLHAAKRGRGDRSGGREMATWRPIADRHRPIPPSPICPCDDTQKNQRDERQRNKEVGGWRPGGGRWMGGGKGRSPEPDRSMGGRGCACAEDATKQGFSRFIRLVVAGSQPTLHVYIPRSRSPFSPFPLSSVSSFFLFSFRFFHFLFFGFFLSSSLLGLIRLGFSWFRNLIFDIETKKKTKFF